MNPAPGQMPDERETMSYEDAARFLGVVIERLYVLVSRGHFHPIKTKGTRFRRLLREEVERYDAGRYLSRADMIRESAAMLIDTLIWGVSDDGPGGAMMRQRVLEQAERLRVSDAGREALAGIRDNLQDILEHDPIIQADSASRERERLHQLRDIINDALAVKIEDANAVKKPARQRAKSPDAPTPKRGRLTATPK